MGRANARPMIGSAPSRRMKPPNWKMRQSRSFRELRKALRHRPIHLAPEGHDEIGDAVEPLPLPLVELRRLAVAWRQRIDFIVGPGETQREPFLPLATEFCESV